MSEHSRHLAIVGATIIDGNGGKPIENGVLLIKGKRIAAVGDHTMPIPPDAELIRAKGKFVIPGLMNANVHLWGLHPLESIVGYAGRYEDLILESAQIALKNGLTTVFDTLGPRRYLMAARDRINSGEAEGARFFCAGNIIGMDGPFSADFLSNSVPVVTGALAKRINSIWVENVGRHLMWLTPQEVAHEVGVYIGKGIDFIKFASNDHYPGAFLAFSPRVQKAMVDEAHRRGVSAQSHSMSVEGLYASIEAGCDLITHCNISGPRPIPDETLELMAEKRTGAVVFAFTDDRHQAIMKVIGEEERMLWTCSEINARNLIKAGTNLLFANDGTLVSREWAADKQWGNTWITTPGEENLCDLGTGHFSWFKAMEQKGCEPMRMLQAVTKNIAVAYKQEKDLGTLEKGKFADLLILDENPLAAAKNYRSIHTIMKEGRVIDRDSLPLNPIVTAPAEPPVEEEAFFKPFIAADKFPMCPTCAKH